MIKRLIFDVDGTLITGVNFVNAIKRTLSKLSILSDNNVQLFLHGIKTYELKYNNYNKKDYINHFSQILNCKLDDSFLSILFEELKTAIPPQNKALKNKIHELSLKYELVLLTNYFSESQFNKLNLMGIGKYFSEAYGEDRIKPNKKAYIMACGNNNPDECVMIGDDIFLDIKRAKEEGLKTIMVNTNQKSIPSDIGTIVDSVEDITIEMIENL